MRADQKRQVGAPPRWRRIALRSWSVALLSMLSGLGLYRFDNWYERMPTSWVKTLLDDLEIVLMGPGMGILALVLSESARVKEQAHRETLAAEHDARFRMLGRIAASVAHEIRNPLHNLHLIGNELPLATPDGVAPLIRRAQNNIARLHDAVRLVYELAKPAAPRDQAEVRDVALAPLVDELVADERRRDPAGAVYDIAPIAASPVVRAREAALRIIVHNLMRNSARAVGPGGRVSIAFLDQNDAWLLFMANRGTLPPEVLADGEPLMPQGLGIGLSIARHLATNLGADLRLTQRGDEVCTALRIAKGGFSG